MEIIEILSNKALKPKEKIEKLCQRIMDKEINIKDLLVYAKTAKDVEKGTCIEALEFASTKYPKIINKKCFEFVVEHLSDKAPRVKWECAKIIGNTAHLYKTDLSIAIEYLLQNAAYDGTVVRWSAAFALLEIIKLETDHNKKLIPKINEICAKEEKSNIKKMYNDGIKMVNGNIKWLVDKIKQYLYNQCYGTRKKANKKVHKRVYF